MINEENSTWLNDDHSSPHPQRTRFNAPSSVTLRQRTSAEIMEEQFDPDDPLRYLYKGDIITTGCGRVLKIVRRLGEAGCSGEGDVYLCENSGVSLVVKIFRHSGSIFPEKLEALLRLKSELVAPIIDCGILENRYFEVYPYYSAGSLAETLEKRTFSYDELVRVIIPALSNAIRDLHDAGILHRDIKPANIMWMDESHQGVVLIDFGLSSILKDDPLESLVSRIAFTMDYAAPEILHGRYYKDSDYYSMGIVLYTLFTGHTPFSRNTAASSFFIPRPRNMPDNLFQLILGLTLADVSNQPSSGSTARRWGYDEIWDWLEGKPVTLPQGPTASDKPAHPAKPLPSVDPSIPPFVFLETTYTDMNRLCLAMSNNWQEAWNLIRRGTLPQHLRRQNATDQQALWASNIEDIYASSAYNADQKLLRILLSLTPEKSFLPSPLGGFFSLEEYGKHLFKLLDSPELSKNGAFAAELLLSAGALSAFAEAVSESDKTIDFLKRFEQLYQTDRWKRQRMAFLWEMAYELSGYTQLNPGLSGSPVFDCVEDLKTWLKEIADKGDYQYFYMVCSHFLDGTAQLKPRVYGWLRHQGYPLYVFNV